MEYQYRHLHKKSCVQKGLDVYLQGNIDLHFKSRGLSAPPEIAVGDGALGFWKAQDEIFPKTKHQRCWVHKVKNVLNHFPKPMAVAVKSDLNDISHAETRAEASIAMDLFSKKYSVKFEKAVRCLIKDRDALLAFYDFPAEHWIHLRTSNPIEIVFATVRHRTIRTKGALSQKTAKPRVFTIIQEASKKWLRLKVKNQLPKVIQGVKFNDGIEINIVDENQRHLSKTAITQIQS